MALDPVSPLDVSRTAVVPSLIPQGATSIPLLGRVALGLALSAAVPVLARAQANTDEPVSTTRGTSTVLDMTLGAMRSDNVRRTADNEVEDTLATVGLVADVSREGTRLDYSLKSDIAWTEYLDDSYDGLPIGYLDGLLGIGSERFRWNFQDTFDQAIVDAFRPFTPDNLQSVNYFTTGPQLNLLLTSATRLTLRADYSVVTSNSDSPQFTDLDSTRYSGSLVLTRDISNTSSPYLSADAQHIDYDDPANADYNRQAFYLGYRGNGSRTTLNGAIGYVEIGGDSETSGGWAGRFELARRVSPASTISVYASRDISDATNLFRSGPDRRTPIQSSTEIATADVFVTETIGAGWAFQMAHTGFSLGGSASKEEHDADPKLDRTTKGANASFSRLMTPLLSLSLAASYRREDFDTTSFENEIVEASAGLSWRVGHRVTLSLLYDRYDQNSTDDTAAFTENRAGLNIVYHFAAQAQ